MNANSLRKTTSIFSALTIAGIALIVLGQQSNVAELSTTLPWIGTAFFAASLTYFLLATAHLESRTPKAALPLNPLAKALTLFVALTVTGVCLIVFGSSAAEVVVNATLPLVGTALFTAGMAFFLVRGGQLQV